MDKKIILLIAVIVVISLGCIKTEEQKSALNTSHTQKTNVNASEDACPIGSGKCGNSNAKEDPCEGVEELLALGKYESENKSYDKAIEYYTKAIELAPACYEAYFMRGYIHGTLGFMEQKNEEYYKAIEDFDKVLEMDPNNPDALYYKGMCLSNLGEKEKAKEVYKNASEINPLAKREYEELTNKS